MFRVGLLSLLVLISWPPFAWGATSYVVGGQGGDPQALESLLLATRLVDAEGSWSGGSARLVLLGDFLPACPASERAATAILERLTTLEREAAAAGGELLAILGPAELGCLLSGSRLGDADSLGDWLAARPLFALRDGSAFVHGGFSRGFVAAGLEAAHAQARAELAEIVRARRKLRGARGISPEMPPVELVGELARRLDADELDEPVSAPARRFLELSGAWVLGAEGPLFYEGTALGSPTEEGETVAAALEALGARRIVASAPRVAGGRVIERLAGRVLCIEDGGSAEVAFVEIARERVRVHLRSGEIEEPLVESAGGHGLAASYSEEEDRALESFLAEAEVVGIEEIGTGITKPERLTLRLGDKERRAAFKTIDQQIQKAVRVAGRGELSFSDRYVYEVAAYRLDRLMGLGATPVTILREIAGREGSVQLWVEDSLNELERRERDLGRAQESVIERQKNLMHVFDVLIFNTDRNQTNMLFTRADWRLHLIDHSRAFRLDRGRPRYLEGRVIPLSDEVVARLEALTFEALEERLEGLLSRAQMRSILKRRDQLLEDWEGARPRVQR